MANLASTDLIRIVCESSSMRYVVFPKWKLHQRVRSSASASAGGDDLQTPGTEPLYTAEDTVCGRARQVAAERGALPAEEKKIPKTLANQGNVDNFSISKRERKNEKEKKEKKNQKENKKEKEKKRVENKVIQRARTREEKHAFGIFKNVMLTDEEYAKLKEDVRTDYIDRLSAHIKSTGKHYKSHYATCVLWAMKNEIPEFGPIGAEDNIEDYRKVKAYAQRNLERWKK